MSRKLSQNQKTFNKVVRHLLRQGVKSKDGTLCKYRGPNNTKCAVGCLIPNRTYRPEMEGGCAYNTKIKAILEADGHNVDFCSELQSIHDGEPVDMWETELAALAKRYQLTMPTV